MTVTGRKGPTMQLASDGAAAAVAIREGPSLPVRWIAGTFVGWSAGFVLAILFIVAAESVGMPATQFPLALGMGTGVGVMQARVLRPYLGARGPWIAATALGLAAPFIVADLARGLGFALPYMLSAYVALGGLLAGILQWPLLRGLVARAAWWVPASLVGWSLGGATVALNDLLPKTPGLVGALQYVGVVLAGGLLLGSAGAAVLGAIVPARRG